VNGGIAIDLGAEGRNRLNPILDGCFWNACFIDEQARMGIVVVELVGVSFEDQRRGDAYPVVMACYPVSRVAASYKVNGLVRALDLRDINAALHEFSSKEVDDWDIIDPPADQRFLWQQDLSLDVSLSGSLGTRTQEHFLELWQDDGSLQSLSFGLWFCNLFLFDGHMNALTLDGLERARKKRQEAFGEIGWYRTARVPSLNIDDLLDKIQSG
jgi:hypothetical protein